MKIENIAGIVVNVDETLQSLLGETKIEQDGGYYILNVDNQSGDLNVTVDYGRTEADPEKGLVPIGIHCVFNETYSFDPCGENPFSFARLIEDLHDQHLEDVENWIISFLEEKFH